MCVSVSHLKMFHFATECPPGAFSRFVFRCLICVPVFTFPCVQVSVWSSDPWVQPVRCRTTVCQSPEHPQQAHIWPFSPQHVRPLRTRFTSSNPRSSGSCEASSSSSTVTQCFSAEQEAELLVASSRLSAVCRRTERQAPEAPMPACLLGAAAAASPADALLSALRGSVDLQRAGPRRWPVFYSGFDPTGG